jgi:hypothetical protein
MFMNWHDIAVTDHNDIDIRSKTVSKTSEFESA